ncbi:MAG: hypothetical protein Kow0092_16930 [Deferrisomatales bacterium]
MPARHGFPFRPLFLLCLLVAATLAVLAWLVHATDAVRSEARDRFFEQYNRQQLLLAELASRTIEELFDTFHRNLGLVVSLFEGAEVSRARAAQVSGSLQKVYDSLSSTPIIDLVVFDREGTVVAIYPSDPYTLGRNYAWRNYYLWARDRGAAGQMYLSPFMVMEGGKHRGDKALIVAQGIYGQEEESEGARGRTFHGVVAFTVNFDELARKHVLSVRIGEHGYAWLVDSNDQRVLVAPQGRMGGQRFEEAFLPRWPRLYDLLVATKEGKPATDWYEYKDPADPEKTVRKLAALVPVRIEDRLWTLGVATPEREVEAVLASFLRRQETVSEAIVAVVLFGAVALSGLLITWNQLLSRQVTRRTRDLAEARSQLEAAFEELLAAKKLAAVGQMALGLAHEIRNPLSAIRMNVQMIRKKTGPSGILEENFAIVEEEILRLNRLLNDVMGFARPRPLRPEPVDVGALAGRVLQVMDGRLRAAGIETEAEFQGDLEALVDPEQLQQVFWNLFVNAVEAMDSVCGPKVLTVRVGRQGDSVCIRVTDTGAGLRPGDREKIFDPFYTSKAGGGGLGLSTVQSIVLRHGGSVDVHSRRERGTEFTVRLPVDGPSGRSQLLERGP